MQKITARAIAYAQKISFSVNGGLSDKRDNIVFILCNDATQRANALHYLTSENNYKYVYECDIDYILQATNKNITFLITNSFPVANVKNDNIMRYSYNDAGVTCEINGVEC